MAPWRGRTGTGDGMSRRLQLGGLGLAVRDSGPADAPAVLLLHGNPDSADVWDGTVAAFAADGGPPLRCIRPDMPGFGDSPLPPPGFDYRPGATVPLWDALLDALGVTGPVVAVVHDFGGPWLLPWVARRPERVHGMVVANSPYTPAFSWHVWARIWQTPLLGELTLLPSPRALFAWEMRRGSRGLSRAHCDATHAKVGPAMRRAVLRTYRAFRDLEGIFGHELPLLLRGLDERPRAVLHGAADPYIPVHHAEVFGVAPTVVPGVGHWLPVERPDLVAAAVRQVWAAAPAPLRLTPAGAGG